MTKTCKIIVKRGACGLGLHGSVTLVTWIVSTPLSSTYSIAPDADDKVRSNEVRLAKDTSAERFKDSLQG